MVQQHSNRQIIVLMLAICSVVVYQFYTLHYIPTIIQPYCQYDTFDTNMQIVDCIACYNFNQKNHELGSIYIETFGSHKHQQSHLIYQKDCYEYQCASFYDPIDFLLLNENNLAKLQKYGFNETVNNYNSFNLSYSQNSNRKGFILRFKYLTQHQTLQKPKISLLSTSNSFIERLLLSIFGLISINDINPLFLLGFISFQVSFIISICTVYYICSQKQCTTVAFIITFLWGGFALMTQYPFLLPSANSLLVIVLYTGKNNSIGYLHLTLFVILSLLCFESNLIEIGCKIPQLIYFVNMLGPIGQNKTQQKIRQIDQEDIELKIKKQLDNI